MPDMEGLKTAEANVAGLQAALTTVQTGLQHIEQVAETVERAKAGSKRLARIALAGLGIALVIVVVTSLRRRRRSQPIRSPATTDHGAAPRPDPTPPR